MKILTVIGARPQFIKAAVISQEIDHHPDIQEIVIHTGQHFDANMSQIFFDQLGMRPPDYNLGISNAPHGAMTGRMLEQIEAVFLKEKPDWVIVYGDTNSTLAGALAATKIHIPVAHVEAGLRSFNMRMPEEINRILTDRLSTLLCCPTDAAVHNLQNEGFDEFPCKVVKTGDVMKDVALHYQEKALRPPFPIPDSFFLVTIHRAENTDNPLRLQSILDALRELSEQRDIILPLHPRTAQYLHSWEFPIPPGLKIVDPVGFLEMIYLIKHSELILTDSGGLQKEAFFHGKPCITLRDETEWTELVSHGFNIISGTETKTILQAVERQLSRELDYNLPLYGMGDASAKIIRLLKTTNP